MVAEVERLINHGFFAVQEPLACERYTAKGLRATFRAPSMTDLHAPNAEEEDLVLPTSMQIKPACNHPHQSNSEGPLLCKESPRERCAAFGATASPIRNATWPGSSKDQHSQRCTQTVKWCERGWSQVDPQMTPKNRFNVGVDP